MLGATLALVTCAPARELDTDLPLLLPELPEAEVVVWDDPAVDWSRYETVVIRSTWDYHERRDAFLAWARTVAEVAALWNPPDLIEWNTDKRYLGELAARGIATVRSTFVPIGETADPADLAGDVVIKPTVGAGSIGVARCRHDPDAARTHVARLHAAGRTAMIQPYVAGVDTGGETGLVYLGGEFSHAFGKDPILAGPIEWQAGLYAQERIEPRRPDAAERALGDRVVATLPPTAYARVDLLPTADGPVVLEIELTEPSLFLECDAAAPARAAAAFRSLDV